MDGSRLRALRSKYSLAQQPQQDRSVADAAEPNNRKRGATMAVEASLSIKRRGLDTFLSATGATDEATASQFLEAACGDVEAAIREFRLSQGAKEAAERQAESAKQLTVEAFLSVTGADEATALHYLEAAKSDVEAAISKFFDYSETAPRGTGPPRSSVAAKAEPLSRRDSALGEDDVEEEEGEVVYYSVNNLTVVLETVVQHYSHILNREEHWMLERFRALPLAAKNVWSRLHPRKYRFYRRGNLRITHVSATELESGLDGLEAAGFALGLDHKSQFHLSNAPERAACILRLFKATELRSMAAANGVVGSQKISRNSALDQLCALVRAPDAQQQPLRGQAKLGFGVARDGAVSLQKAICNALDSSNKVGVLPDEEDVMLFLSTRAAVMTWVCLSC
jgi:hypothetical protein